MSQKYNILFYATIVALVLVLPGQVVAQEGNRMATGMSSNTPPPPCNGSACSNTC